MSYPSKHAISKHAVTRVNRPLSIAFREGGSSENQKSPTLMPHMRQHTAQIGKAPQARSRSLAHFPAICTTEADWRTKCTTRSAGINSAMKVKVPGRVTFKTGLMLMVATSVFIGQALCLSDLIAEALAKNGAIATAQKQYEAVRQRPCQASCLPDPMFSPGWNNGNPLPGANRGVGPTSV